MLISVIITTYNRPEALAATIQGLLDQTDSDFEIVIADDGSSASTLETLFTIQRSTPKHAARKIVYTWQPDKGFRASAARNMGVFSSRGEYLIFLDGDCVPRPTFVAHHRMIAEIRFMVSGSRVLLSQRLTNKLLTDTQLDPVARRSFLYWLQQRLMGNTNKVIPLISLPDSRLRHYRSVRWNRIKSCNLAIWRNDFLAVNGFDESFVGWGHEDADLVLRLARYGIQRKGGAFSTEVFHLWHKENTRTTESENRLRVETRIKSGTIKAPIGLSQYPRSENFVLDLTRHSE